MDADRTDPAMDSGPTCGDGVQTVQMRNDFGICDDCLQPPEACAECENGLMFVRREDDVDYDPDDLGMDPDEGPMDNPCDLCERTGGCVPECGRCAEYRAWHRFCVNERGRGVTTYLRNKGYERRALRWLNQYDKRRSAMRRQGKGGGR